MTKNFKSIINALNFISPDLPRNEWVKIGFSIKANNCDFSVFHDWSKNAQNYKSEKDCLSVWNGDKGGSINKGYLFKVAQDNGFISTGDNSTQFGNGFYDNPVDWFSSLQNFSSHDYAIKQQISDKLSGFNIKQGSDGNGAFIADPIYNIETGEICGFNRIYGTGGNGKRLAPKSKKTGNAGVIGKVFSDIQTLFVVEGLADAVHVNNLYNSVAFVASDAGNIEAVTVAIRNKYPNNPIKIIADNDKVGLKAALRTACSIDNVLIGLPLLYKDVTEMVLNDSSKIINIPISTGTSGAMAAMNDAVIGLIGNCNKDHISDLTILRWIKTVIKNDIQDTAITFQRFVRVLQQKSGLSKPDMKRIISNEEQQVKFDKLKESGTDNALVTFNKQGEPVLTAHSKAAEILTNISDIILNLRFDDIANSWMGYQDNCWSMSTDARVDGFVLKAIKQQAGDIGFSDSYLKGVRNLIKPSIISSEWDGNKNLIGLKNGILNLNDNTIMPQDKKHRITNQLPFDYDPKATCPNTMQFLLDCVGGDVEQQQILRAFMNCIVKGRADLQRCLVIVGMGGTGKGTFMRLCANLVGNRNLHTSNFKHLEGATGRFEVGKLYRKKLLIIPDADQYTGSVETFKSITGQDPLRYEKKNENNDHNSNFIYDGMAIIASNEPLAVNDHTSGWKRRTLNLTFDNAFNRRDGDLGTKLSAELSGILNWILAMPDNEVTDYVKSTVLKVGSARQLAFDALVLGNPLAAWVHDNLIMQDGNAVQIGVKKEVMTRSLSGDSIKEYFFENERLYPNYLAWCDSTGRKPQAVQKFSGLLSNLFKSPDMLNISEDRVVKKLVSLDDEQTLRRRVATCFVGLAIKTDDTNDSQSPIDFSLEMFRRFGS